MMLLTLFTLNPSRNTSNSYCQQVKDRQGYVKVNKSIARDRRMPPKVRGKKGKRGGDSSDDDVADKMAEQMKKAEVVKDAPKDAKDAPADGKAAKKKDKKKDKKGGEIFV